MRRPPADRPVVAEKSLLSGGGGGAKGPAHQECSFRSTRAPWVLGGSEENMPTSQVKPFDIPKQHGVGGVQAGCGQQGCTGSGRGDPGRVRGRSEEQPLQDLEPDELGVLLSAPGASGGDTEAARWRGPLARRAHDRRPGCPNGGGHVPGGEGGAPVPPRLLWLPAGKGSLGCAGGVPAAVLEVRLGHRSRCPEVLRHGAVGPRRSRRWRRSPTCLGCCCT